MRVVGRSPDLPGPLAALESWRVPVPAERLAAWRIATGLAVLVALFVYEIPSYEALYGPDAWVPTTGWADARLLEMPRACLAQLPASALLGALGFGGLSMVLGWFPRFGALLAFAATGALGFQRPGIFYGSDQIQVAMLFYMALAPTDATWVLGRREIEPTAVHPWPFQLAWVHLTVAYFATGLSKLQGPPWVDGTATIFIFNNPVWARFPEIGARIPDPVFYVGTWGVLAWELLFPVLILRPKTRLLALALGVSFHVATFLFVRVGGFSLYMLLFYVPLLPWERLPELLGQRQNR